MTRNVYAVIECCRCIGNSVIAECMCIFENEKDAESFYLTLVEKTKTYLEYGLKFKNVNLWKVIKMKLIKICGNTKVVIYSNNIMRNDWEIVDE